MELKDCATYARLTEVDWQVIRDTAKGCYVEVGTFHGASACAASINAQSVATIDVYNWRPKVWGSDPNHNKITFFKGTSEDFVALYDQSTPWINVLFIDGSHEYDSVKKDCEALVPLVMPGGTVMFHDHNPNNPATGVWAAVNEYLQKIPHQARPKVAGSSNLLIIDIPNT